MKYLLCYQIARPAAEVGQALRFGEVRPLSPQFLGQYLLLGDVDGGAEKPFEDSLFNDWICHAADVAHLAVGPNNSLCYVEAAVLLIHDLNRFRHGGSVLWMNEGQILLNRRGSVLRVQPKNLVQLFSPIMT